MAKVSKPIARALSVLASAGGELTFWPVWIKISVPETMAARGLVEYLSPSQTLDGRVRWHITELGRNALGGVARG